MTDPAMPQPTGRWGPWFAVLWLFFLIDPLRAAWERRDEARGVVGMLATIAFAAVYFAVWLWLRRDRARLIARPALRTSLLWFGAMVLLAVVMVVSLGQVGTAAAVYCSVVAVMLFRPLPALCLVAALAGLVVLPSEAIASWDSGVGTAFGVVAGALAVFGLMTVLERNTELIRARDENAALAIENERTRFARDLHDILGHSLTVITVKAELAGRLLEVDPARAKTEVADLERLSRDALVDVRRAVEGYRDLSLPGELARARTALAAANITADLPGSTDDVPTDIRELFAWTVREGVTNVLRHSNATRCSVVLTPTSVEVRDDGNGPQSATFGHGLLGLRERASTLGATVVTSAENPGYRLRVVMS